MVDCKTCEYENVCEMPDFVKNNLKLCKTHTPKIKRTNAMRIRAMSDAELAEFLVNFNNNFGTEYEGEMSCLEWLQSEAE